MTIEPYELARDLPDVRTLDRTGDAGRMDSALASLAACHVAEYEWGRKYGAIYLGGRCDDALCVCLVNLARPATVASGQWQWVSGGRLPPAYLCADQAGSPLEACAAFLDMLTEWCDAVFAARQDTFPIRARRSPEAARSYVQIARDTRSALRAGAWRTGSAGGGANSRAEVRPGDLVVDWLGRFSLVVEPTDVPDPKWLRLQREPRMRNPDGSPWWRAAPIAGGSINAPSSALTSLGTASAIHVEVAQWGANAAGRDTLARVRSLL